MCVNVKRSDSEGGPPMGILAPDGGTYMFALVHMLLRGVIYYFI